MYCTYVHNLTSLFYSHLEDIENDVRYLAAKSGLGIKLEREVSSTHKKVTKDMAAKEKRFWSRVELGTLLKVLQFYKEDLMLFGYSAADYFEELGLLKILDV